jgi:glutathione S-transferase
MIVLSAFGPLWGLPDPSPFVGKTEVQLKMAGLPYQKERKRPPEGPKGKMPFIVDGEDVVGDSTFIRDHIERKYGVDLDAGLTPRQRALAWMAERVVEDHIYWATIYARWGVPENFEKGPAIFFQGAPDEVRETGRQNALRNLHGQGFGRHSLAEVAGLVGRSFTALSEVIGEQPYLTGGAPCGADATVFAGLGAVLTPHFDTPVRDALLTHANLVAYVERMNAQFYPDVATAAAAQ